MIEIKEITAAETWPLRHKVMWPNKPFEFVILPEDEDGLHYGLYEKERLVSVISLFKFGNEGQFRKFATDKDFQGKGYGSKLLNYLMKEAKLLNIKYLFCSARVNAISLYEKFGMKVVSDVVRKNGKDYVKMEIVLNE
ncbi:GNAT family N-acetyltransferase [Emticicia sp. SJ17W-69]|uniref:GNAT family N-acetyltransferase n=1 Tax=Emticicia sp. SJ17W-69 TaxID=3421657 RepID=UPI003EB9D40B